LKNKRPTWCHLLFYFFSYALNMFRTLIYPSSGACDCAVEIPHRSFCSRFVVCWRYSAAGFEPATRTLLKSQPHQISNTQRTENTTTNAVIQQHSRKLLMMDILMSETCWAHKKWNKITSDIKLVSYSSTITMMHGPINMGSYALFKRNFAEQHKKQQEISLCGCPSIRLFARKNLAVTGPILVSVNIRAFH